MAELKPQQPVCTAGGGIQPLCVACPLLQCSGQGGAGRRLWNAQQPVCPWLSCDRATSHLQYVDTVLHCTNAWGPLYCLCFSQVAVFCP